MHKRRQVTIKPEYYDTFACTAAACRHNCCRGGWLIELDEETARYYMALKGETGEKLRASLVTDEEGGICFHLTGGQCPHLDAQGLCSICLELGEEHMGVICREFPRFTLGYADVEEKGIGLACEEAARIILYDADGFGLVRQETESKTEASAMDVDYALAGKIAALRDTILGILQAGEGKRPLGGKLREILQLAKEFQSSEISENKQDDCVPGACGEELFSIEKSHVIFSIYRDLEVLEPEWERALDNMERLLHADNVSAAQYHTLLEETVQAIEGGEQVLARLCAYLIYRYLMRAVYDYNVLDKIKFAVTFYWMFLELLTVKRLENGKLDAAAVVECARLLSRQVEYSEDNMDVIWEELLFGVELS